MCVCLKKGVCVKERERVCEKDSVCVKKGECVKERERESVCVEREYVCVCV